MVKENIKLKARVLRIYPNAAQTILIKQWFGTSRYMYNKAVDISNEQNGKIPPWTKLKLDIMKRTPEWHKNTPYHVKGLAVKEFCDALKNAKSAYIKTKIFSDMKHRNKKDVSQSISIPKLSVKKDGIYPHLLDKIKISENIPVATTDCKLVMKHSSKFYLVVPIAINHYSDNQETNDIVALDPGVRTFQTFYSADSAGSFGKKGMNKIFKLCLSLDRLISEKQNVKSRVKRRMEKACQRIRDKIKNLRNEIHWKVSKFLCQNFKIIFIPKFETQKMSQKLNHKVSRKMLTWSHFLFKQRLIFKASEYNVKVIEVNESYTSKTCTKCGLINSLLGSNKIFKCSACKLILDRDINGARNIFMKHIMA